MPPLVKKKIQANICVFQFTTPGSTQAASQLKKVVAPQTSYTGGAGALGYNSSYVTQAGGSYNYGGNKQAAAVSNVQTPKTTSLGAGVRKFLKFIFILSMCKIIIYFFFLSKSNLHLRRLQEKSAVIN